MADTDSHAGPSEHGETRADESGGTALSLEENVVRRWILINGNRWVVSAVALLVVGLGLVGLGMVWTDELVTLFTETQVIQTVFITLLSGIILLVSIAVSVNSVVLSQEITSLGDQEEEIDETFSFRDSVQEYTHTDTSPARPAAFLQVIFEAIQRNAQALLDSVPADDSALHDQVEALRDDIVYQVGAVEHRLNQGEFGTSEVLFAGIQYDYSRQVHAVRQLRAEHAEELTESQLERIDDLLTVLKYFTIGREYIKTLYFKREMANLSRGLLTISFPALVFLSYALLSLRAGLVPEVAILGVPSLILFVGFTYIAGLAPYTLFSAYIFRTATISIKTLAAGPFILDSGSGYSRLDGVADDHSE